MYRSRYQKIIAKYGNRARLTHSNTDSFVYLIETRNICDDMAANIDAFDTSENRKTHPLHSRKNAKTLVNFKDECNSLQPHELIGLRSNMYSLKLSNGRIKITSKGCHDYMYSRILSIKTAFIPSKQQLVLRYIQNNNIAEACCQDSRS